MSAEGLYDDLQKYLRLSCRVIQKAGGNINVDENFTLRFTGSNTAYSAGYVGKPRIIFQQGKIYVKGTQYAEPVDGAGWHELPDNNLYPGEASFVDVEMKALDEIDSFFVDLVTKEHVAKSWLTANLDAAKFFEIWAYKDIKEEIDPT